ncbi:hypothetical protein SapgrDRAFT_3344 [Saprospira grandis DSM 2844]|uniref:Endonuclease GajA/Old nuclease/RecF-like AAA domain-containing protein n=1 Tax=Saprospira grandis DSM 2844 TaxID=694433 RepID=J0Y0D2_9BACT|nr:AAA family ATPase [Saprospira grandis]EJF54986.1 hypothetical protein SapgrDRAFT_3344 [Saprospira grandis DSM 2844]
MESLEIQGFAGFKDLKIELNKINLFIGPQASGKSVLMKLAYFFRKKISSLYILIPDHYPYLKDKLVSQFKVIFPSSSWPSTPFYIQYEYNGLQITIIKSASHLKIEFSDQLEQIIENIHSEFVTATGAQDMATIYQTYGKEACDQIDSHIYNFFMEELRKVFIDSIYLFYQMVPSGRSFFAFLQENIFSFLRSENELDPSFVDFASEYERMKKTLARENREGRELLPLEQELEVLIQQVLKGKYVQEVDGDFLSLADGRHINLLQASSGQQEVLPLLQVIRHWFRRTKTAVSLYIEEPETHLFPQAQRQVLEALILMYNAHEADMHLEISTHSPYLISVLNNMLLAGQLAQNEKVDQKALDQKHPPYLRVKKEELSAYMLKDGAAFSLWDEETGLLNAQILDEVGENIDRDFDELLNLEPYE